MRIRFRSPLRSAGALQELAFFGSLLGRFVERSPSSAVYQFREHDMKKGFVNLAVFWTALLLGIVVSAVLSLFTAKLRV
jgi:hypothetical protein